MRQKSALESEPIQSGVVDQARGFTSFQVCGLSRRTAVPYLCAWDR